MSVVDVKERYALAKAEVQGLRDKLRAKRADLLDTDGESSSSHSCHLQGPLFQSTISRILQCREREGERESSIPSCPAIKGRGCILYMLINLRLGTAGFVGVGAKCCITVIIFFVVTPELGGCERDMWVSRSELCVSWFD